MRWCNDQDDVSRIVQFVIANITPDYISHYEVMSGRAVTFDQWAPDHADQLVAEYRAILGGETPSKILAVRDELNNLIGVAVVGFAGEGDHRHAVIEDMIVGNKARGKGVGLTMVEWVAKAAQDSGCKRLFLESGFANEKAHNFFERAGFQPVSKTFHMNLTD